MSSIATVRNRPGMRAKAALRVPAPKATPRSVACGHDIVERLLEAARRSAELASLDPAMSVVDDATHAQCLGRLAAPARLNEPLRRMLKTAAPWDPA